MEADYTNRLKGIEKNSGSFENSSLKILSFILYIQNSVAVFLFHNQLNYDTE